MGIFAKLGGLFRKAPTTGDTPKKGKSLVDHFKGLRTVKDTLFVPLDRTRCLRQTFQRPFTDIETLNMDVVGGKARFSVGGKVWAFDEATQTPITRKSVDNENVSAINQYKAFTNDAQNIPDEIFEFYSRGFITWTTCAQFAQHEIINRACAVRGEDAVAVGYKISYADSDQAEKGGGKETKEDKEKSDYLAALMKVTKRMGIDEILRKLDYNKCVFGIGIAVPTFDGDVDMSLPFNIDTKGLETYTGYTVIEPYWLIPQFDEEAASDPSSKHFFEPTWWRLPNGKLIHRSWCTKVVNSYVSDILKPTYIYGGIPLTQMIYERVFAADKCANEAPMLALTKRLLVVDANIQQVLADPKHVKDLMDVVTYCRTNWGVMFKQPTANINQIDTSLGEYDQLIMTQYQLVASIAQMPATKLLKVTPTGFQSTGEYEWKDWAQSLMDVQEMEFTPLLERHFQLLSKKKGKLVAVNIRWNAVDAPTAKEKADIQATKASTYSQLLSSGAVSPEEVRDVMRNDEEGEFTALSKDPPQKDGDLMAQLTKQMGGEPPTAEGAENPNAGDSDESSVVARDDAEFERKHKRDGDGRFSRGAGELSQSIVEYKKEKGGKQAFDPKTGKHLYAEVRKSDGKPWHFPKAAKTGAAEERKIAKRTAAIYNGGDTTPDLKYWNANKKAVKFTGKTELSEFKKSELITRSARPKYGFAEEVRKVKGKNKKVRVVVAKEGKPQYEWTVGGRKLSDEEAFSLEHALVNGGYGKVLGAQARDVVVRPDYGNGVGHICGMRATGDSAFKAELDPKTARANKNLHIAQINSVYANATKIVDRIVDDFDNRPDDDFAVLAYFQLVSTCRVGSPSSMNDGALNLTPENVTVVGDKVYLDFDAKNGRWHTEFEDKALAHWFKTNGLPYTKKGEAIFGNTNYKEYCDYLTEMGEEFGITKRKSGDGFTSHNLRHLAASMFASREVDKIKVDPKKDPEGYIAAIEDVVHKTALRVNDGDGVVFKSYIAPDALWKNAMHIYESDDRFVPPTGR